MELGELSISINKINSSIQSEDRKKRKEVLGEISTLLKTLENEKSLFAFESFQPALIKSLNDQAESVRTAAVQILQKSIVDLPQNNKLLDDIIPILVYRLGDIELREQSEELRLNFIELLRSVIETYGTSLEMYTEDIVQVLSKTLVDSYPKLRQESALCCKALVEKVTQEMYHHGFKLVKPLLANFKQTHFRTRILAIEALCEVMKEGKWKFIEAQEVFGSLGERLFDSVPGVRLAVVQILGDWFLHLRDRYSFFARMIPLILSCLDDEQQDVCERAWVVWLAAGNQYTAENEQELKDKMDFLDGKPAHYPDSVERPNIGCRTLVQRNTLQIMKPLLSELDDWKIEIRIKASYLLVRLILHAEQDVTQHTEYILTSMYSLAEKGDPAILVENVEKAAEYMSYFVESSTWNRLICPILEDSVRLGHLRILSALCRGTRIGALDDLLDPLSKILSDKNVCTTREPLYQTQLLKCCYAILNNVNIIEDQNVEHLYFAITYACAVAGDNTQIVTGGMGVLEKLAEKAGTTITALAASHMKKLMEGLSQSVEVWTSVHPDAALLLFILKQPAAVWSTSIDTITEVLKIALKVERDATMRTQLFIRLTEILTDSKAHSYCGEDIYGHFLFNIVKDMICPNLVWRAGRTSEAVRTTVVACLFNVLDFEQAWEKMEASEIIKVVLPPLIDCLRDSAPDTRLIGLKCISKVVLLAHGQDVFLTDHVNFIYSEVLGRLDDVSNEVRSTAVDCLSTIYGNLPEKYIESDYRYHLETVVHTMLTHLDDPEATFQDRLLGTLKVISKRAPIVVKEKLASRRHLFKAQHLCDELQEHLESL